MRKVSPREPQELLPTSSSILRQGTPPERLKRPTVIYRSGSEQTASVDAEQRLADGRTRPRSIDSTTSHAARQQQSAVELPAEYVGSIGTPHTSTQHRQAGPFSSIKPAELPGNNGLALNRSLQQPQRGSNTSHAATSSSEVTGTTSKNDSQQHRAPDRTMEIRHVPASQRRIERRAEWHVSDTQQASDIARVSDTAHMRDQSSVQTVRRPAILGEANTSNSISQARPIRDGSTGSTYQELSRPSYAEMQARQPSIEPTLSSLSVSDLEHPPDTPSPGSSLTTIVPSLRTVSSLSELSDYDDIPQRGRQSQFSLRHMISGVFSEADRSEASRASSTGRRRPY